MIPKTARRWVGPGIVLMLALLTLAYVTRYGQCDTRSKFCALDVAGTRSSVVLTWDGDIELFGTTAEK